MNGEYLRVTPAELAKAISTSDWAYGLAEEIRNGEDELSPAHPRALTTHKAWHAIAFLTGRAGLPVDIVHGEDEVAEDEDWGYGPPRSLSVQRVQEAAAGLAAT